MSKKIHYHNPRFDHADYPNAVSCNWTQRNFLDHTTDPEKVTCGRCLTIMRKPYQTNEDLKRFFATHPTT